MDTNAGGVEGGVIIKPRPKNRQALADLNITALERLGKIRGLRVDDACHLLESDYPEEAASGRRLWVFGTKLKKAGVYVKIQFGEHNDAPICISFHRAEHELVYLFR